MLAVLTLPPHTNIELTILTPQIKFDGDSASTETGKSSSHGMISVANLKVVPFGSDSYAVQFQPEGLPLYDFAILTITPAQEIPFGQQIFFGYLRFHIFWQSRGRSPSGFDLFRSNTTLRYLAEQTN